MEIEFDRLSNVTVGAGMIEAAVEWTAHSNPVTAEDRAARAAPAGGARCRPPHGGSSGR